MSNIDINFIGIFYWEIKRMIEVVLGSINFKDLTLEIILKARLFYSFMFKKKTYNKLGSEFILVEMKGNFEEEIFE